MKAPAKGILRVGGGNVYVGNKDPDRAVGVAVDTRAHSWGWSEGSNIAGRLERLPNHHALTAFGFADQKDANDCVMMAREALSVVHFSMTQVCKDAPTQAKVAHDRTFSMLAYEAPFLREGDVVCHVAVHPNWVTGFDSDKAPTVKEYLRSLNGLEAMLTFAEAMRWIVVVTGDFNSPQRMAKPFETIYDVFRAHKLQVKTEGLDGVAWSRKLVLDEWHRIPGSKTGTDHDFWTVADLRRRK